MFDQGSGEGGGGVFAVGGGDDDYVVVGHPARLAGGWVALSEAESEKIESESEELKEALAARQAPGGGRASVRSPYGLPEATTLWGSWQPEKLVAKNPKARLGCAQAVRGTNRGPSCGLAAH
nr:hypothetical protein GCM10017745_64930 [Saccharothrix mutabilis subsp. capreolus]